MVAYAWQCFSLETGSDLSPLVNQSQIASFSQKEKKKVPKYTFVAINIPEQPAQITSMCVKLYSVHQGLTK